MCISLQRFNKILVIVKTQVDDQVFIHHVTEGILQFHE